jgi:hypothetical protein
MDILKDIPEYEKLNNIEINVFEFPDNKYDESPSNTRDKQLENKVFNLLLLTNGDKQHFVRIIIFPGLLRKQGDNDTKRHYCSQCLDRSFAIGEAWNNHQEACLRNEACKVLLPKKDGEQGTNKNNN